MLQRDIPDWESFKFGISCLDTALVFMVKLRKAGSHFSTTRSWCSDNDQWSGGFNIVILAKAVIADDMFYIIWVAINAVVAIYLDSHML